MPTTVQLELAKTDNLPVVEGLLCFVIEVTPTSGPASHVSFDKLWS